MMAGIGFSWYCDGGMTAEALQFVKFSGQRSLSDDYHSELPLVALVAPTAMVLKRSVAAISAAAVPGSMAECPASGIRWNSACGIACDNSHEVAGGQTIS